MVNRRSKDIGVCLSEFCKTCFAHEQLHPTTTFYTLPLYILPWFLLYHEIWIAIYILQLYFCPLIFKFFKDENKILILFYLMLDSKPSDIKAQFLLCKLKRFSIFLILFFFLKNQIQN